MGEIRYYYKCGVCGKDGHVDYEPPTTLPDVLDNLRRKKGWYIKRDRRRKIFLTFCKSCKQEALKDLDRFIMYSK